MSLATRCTACGTIFRIVEDQLRVSDGWVRCGRCNEVFDARELLFDMEREPAPDWPARFAPEPPPPEPVAYSAPPEAPAPPPDEPPYSPPSAPPQAWASDPPEASRRDEPAPASAPESFETTEAPAPAEPALDTAPAFSAQRGDRLEPRWVDEPLAPFQAEALDVPTGAAPLTPTPPTPIPTEALPEFMRRARAGERWQQPAVRRSLMAASVVLCIALLAQMTLHFRDAVAALFPALRPAVVALCSVAACKVEPWKRADVLLIETTSLTQMGQRNAYKLGLSLRNTSAVEVAMPWVELSLTDASGALLARRVFPPTALMPAVDRLGAEAEKAFSLPLSTGTHRVTGYTVDVFQP